MPDQSDTSEYHCSTEWHLGRLRSKYASPLYNFALKISATSRTFFCSQLNLARYFGCSVRTIGTAVKELERAGFFVRISARAFQTNRYRVLRHKEWAARNPGRCTTRIEFPWTGEGEEIGRRLYAISGGTAKFLPHQITLLKERFTHEQIEGLFREFWDVFSENNLPNAAARFVATVLSDPRVNGNGGRGSSRVRSVLPAARKHASAHASEADF